MDSLCCTQLTLPLRIYSASATQAVTYISEKGTDADKAGAGTASASEKELEEGCIEGRASLISGHALALLETRLIERMR